MKRTKFILDVNIWVSVLLGKKLQELFIDITENDITILVCPELLEELSEVIARPKFKKYILQDIGHIVESIALFTEMANASKPYPDCPDPGWQKLIELFLSLATKRY